MVEFVVAVNAVVESKQSEKLPFRKIKIKIKNHPHTPKHTHTHTVRLELSVLDIGVTDISSITKVSLSPLSLLFFPVLEIDFLPPPPLEEVLYPSPLFEELGADFRAVLACALLIPLIGGWGKGGGGSDDWTPPGDRTDVSIDVVLPLF